MWKTIGDYSYQVQAQSASWDDVHGICHDINGTLAPLNDNKVKEYAFQILNHHPHVWSGALRQEGSSDWTMFDGSPFPGDLFWPPGGEHPTANLNYNCAVTGGGHIADVPCGDAKRFLCRKPCSGIYIISKHFLDYFTELSSSFRS